MLMVNPWGQTWYLSNLLHQQIFQNLRNYQKSAYFPPFQTPNIEYLAFLFNLLECYPNLHLFIRTLNFILWNVEFYTSGKNFTQALLVRLVTNIKSARGSYKEKLVACYRTLSLCLSWGFVENKNMLLWCIHINRSDEFSETLRTTPFWHLSLLKSFMTHEAW